MMERVDKNWYRITSAGGSCQNAELHVNQAGYPSRSKLFALKILQIEEEILRAMRMTIHAFVR